MWLQDVRRSMSPTDGQMTISHAKNARMNHLDISVAGLRLFFDVAQAGSFAAVARLRGVDPSIISRQIKGLEEALGFRLFDRNTRRLHLTEAGRLYLERTQGLLDELEAAREEATDMMSQPTGRLRMTASTAFGERWLMPRMRGFAAKYSGITLDLWLTDSVVDIAQDGIDLAVRLMPQPEGALVARKLLDTRYHVVASTAYLASAGFLMTPNDLEYRDCLLLPLPGYRSHWRFRKNGVVTEVPVTGRMTISNPLALHRAARDDMGPALLADWIVADDLKSGRLVDCLPGWDASAADFDTAAWLVYPSRHYVPGKLRTMIDHLVATS